jgi:hypothetical protein
MLLQDRMCCERLELYAEVGAKRAVHAHHSAASALAAAELAAAQNAAQAVDAALNQLSESSLENCMAKLEAEIAVGQRELQHAQQLLDYSTGREARAADAVQQAQIEVAAVLGAKVPAGTEAPQGEHLMSISATLQALRQKEHSLSLDVMKQRVRLPDADQLGRRSGGLQMLHACFSFHDAASLSHSNLQVPLELLAGQHLSSVVVTDTAAGAAGQLQSAKNSAGGKHRCVSELLLVGYSWTVGKELSKTFMNILRLLLLLQAAYLAIG